MKEENAIELLRKYAPTEKDFKEVLSHSKIVQKLSVEIAKEIKKNGHKVDIDYIRVACLLHDIGSFDYPPWEKDRIKHGVHGGEILRKEGLIEFVSVCENHIGVGITKEDIIKQKLPLPKKDFIPKNLEEEIIGYVDNLVYDQEVKDINFVIERFTKELGEEYGERVKKLHNKIMKLIGKKI